MDEIVNRVAESGLVTLDLEKLLLPAEVLVVDIKETLFMELILKEKDFRLWAKDKDWEQYRGAVVAVQCSADAIIPTWAYMIVASKLAGIASFVGFGAQEQVSTQYALAQLGTWNMDDYAGKRVVLKGCSNKPVGAEVYVALSVALKPVVKSLMFGEPCSTVPVFKA